MKLQIPPGQTYPPTPPDGLLLEIYYRRGPYLFRQPSGVVELRIPSPYLNEAAVNLWKKNGLRWDPERLEWVRGTTKPLASLTAATRKYEELFPEYAERRPIETPPAAVGRVDFIIAHPHQIVVCEWPCGWSLRDPMVARTEHRRGDFDLAWALDWCKRHGAEIIESADSDYIRALFDGRRSIRTKGQILRKRQQNPTAQVDFAVA